MIICLISQDSWLQTPLHKQFRVEDGLLSNEVHDVLCDSRGFIWFASDAGITRYDGTKFIAFTEAGGLPESCIFKLYEDHKGRIWFASLSSHIGYILNTKITKLPHLFRQQNLVPTESFAYTFNVDKFDRLRVGTIYSGEVYTLNYPYTDKPKKIATKRNVVQYGKNGKIFYCSYGGKNANSNKLEIENYTGKKVKIQLPVKTSRIKKYLMPSHNTLLFYVDSCVYLVRHGKFEKLHAFNNFISFMELGNRGELYLGVVGEGIRIYNSWANKEPANRIFEGNTFLDFCQDRQGAYWASTLNQGVYYLPDLKSAKLFEKELNGFGVQSLVKLGKTSFAFNQTEGPLFLVNKHKINGKLDYEVANISPLFSSFLIAHTQHFSFQYDIRTKKTQALHFQNKPTFLRNSFLKDKNHFYLSENHRVLFFEPKKQLLIDVLNSPSRINSFVIDQHGDFWLCTNDGLKTYLNASKKWLDWGKIHPILSKRADHIILDKKGNKWISLRSYGLVKLDEKGKIIRYDVRHGLLSNFVKHLSEDPDGGIWICTNKGLCKWEGGRNSFADYSFLNTFGLGDLNEVLHLEKELLISSNRGIFSIDQNVLSNNLPHSQIYLDKTLANDSIPVNNAARLAHWQNELHFRFLSPIFAKSSSFTYRYKLIGLNRKWHYTKQGDLTFNNLSPGKYRFLVQALNGKMIIAEAKVFTFTIQAPFWSKWWFILTLLLLVSACIYVLFRRRLQYLSKQKTAALEAELWKVSMEARNLRTQMNPHFIFNALNSIQSFIVSNQNEKAHFYLGKFAKLLRNILEISNQDYVNLKQELEMLQQYIHLESMRMNQHLDYELEIGQHIKTENTLIPSMLIQPYVENAILHGLLPLKERPAKLKIQIFLSNKLLHFVIEDNGIGRERAFELKLKKPYFHDPKSMHISQERLNLYNREIGISETKIIDLFDPDGIPSGTKVAFTIPFEQKNEFENGNH